MSYSSEEEFLESCRTGRVDAVNRLIQYGLSVNLKSRQGWTPLHFAVLGESEPTILTLLSNGADPNVPDNEGFTPLHVAAYTYSEKESIISALISHGAKVNMQTKTGLTPLHRAAKRGKPLTTSALLTHGADPNLTDKQGYTALLIAVEGNDEITVSMLLSNGAYPNVTKDKGWPAILIAAEKDARSIVLNLLSHGANPNVATDKGWSPLHFAVSNCDESSVLALLLNGANPNATNSEGSTPLHIAAYRGNDSLVSALLSHGATTNTTDKLGWTPLYAAVSGGNESSVTALISQGVNPDATNDNGRTPLHAASEMGDESRIFHLISCGANLNASDKAGRTPLHIACDKGYESSILALLSRGANPNVTDKSGSTPFHDAARRCNDFTISTFLSYGANPNMTNKEGYTPLHCAALNGNLQESVILALLAFGAEHSVANTLGQTPLHLAVLKGNDSSISALLTQKADPNVTDKEGRTPLHYAAKNGSTKVIRELLKWGSFLDETDNKGKTAVHIAEESKNTQFLNLYKRIIKSGLPNELLHLSTQDNDSFISNLKSGFYQSYAGKVMCVGHQAVGKTAIISNLRGVKPSPKRQSTEGLDLHIYKAAIDMKTKKWICMALDLEDVAFRDLLQKQKILVTTLENITEVQDDPVDEPVGGRETPSSDKQKPKSFFQWVKQKVGIEKADIHTVEEIKEEAVRRGKKGLIDSNLAPINMMDFGGQTVFYSTHQSFLTYRGIYILVIDGSKDFDEELDAEMFIPGFHGKPTSRQFTFFWVCSIESYSTGTSDEFPKILVVCTHKDKVPNDEAEQRVERIFAEIKKMFEGTSAMKHLVLEHKIFLNAMDPEDPGYEQLKNVLVELVCNQPSWGEKLPKPWIHLKLMINRSVEKGETIMSIDELRAINQRNPVQVLDEKDLQLFLKIQHAQGEIVHYPFSELQNNIVISPAFLVDALRSLVTDPMFCSGHRYKTLESMAQNGLLRQKDIDIIWKENKQMLQHKKYLLHLLEHLDVIAIPRNYDIKGAHKMPDFYYVPSLVKITDDTNYLQDCHSRVLGLSFKFQSKVLPPAIGYKLIASFVDMFEILKYKDKNMLFSGMVVLSVKRDLDIAVFLRPARVDMFLLHNISRFHIVRDTSSGLAECIKDILLNILENYKKTSSSEYTKALERPFTIEYPCFDCSSPCYTKKADDWTCKHGHKVTKEINNVWTIDRKKESCPANCKGISREDNKEIPTDRQLAKLVRQIRWEDMYTLVIRLGLDLPEIQAFHEDYGSNHLNLAFLCLRKWRLKTNKTIKHLVYALQDVGIDIHIACKMLRNKPVGELNIPMEEPTDQLLDSIANFAITESLFLSIELGNDASSWLQMKDDKNKILKINRTILGEWKAKHPRKDQMKDLTQALCNVGLNITSFVHAS